MTSVDVRRATVALCGVFLTAAMAFAWLAERRPPVPSTPASVVLVEPGGATAFAVRCAACHAAEAIAQLIRDAPDRRAKMRAIDALLVSHGDPSPAETRQILAFLEDLASR